MLVLLLLLLTRQLLCLRCSVTQVGWSKWHRKVFYVLASGKGIDPRTTEVFPCHLCTKVTALVPQTLYV